MNSRFNHLLRDIPADIDQAVRSITEKQAKVTFLKVYNILIFVNHIMNKREGRNFKKYSKYR